MKVCSLGLQRLLILYEDTYKVTPQSINVHFDVVGSLTLSRFFFLPLLHGQTPWCPSVYSLDLILQ